MTILSLVVKNVLRNKKKTFLIISLVTVVSCLLLIANTIFETANRGVKKTFSGCLTGDFLISENSEKINSIFGYEMPFVSEYEPVDQLASFLPISEKLDEYDSVLQYSPIISAAVQAEIGGCKYTVPIFGIDNKTYFDVCPDIRVVKGDAASLSPGSRGIFLNESLVSVVESQAGRPLELGEEIILSTFVDGSFRIRKGLFRGVIAYPSDAEPFNKIVLSEPQILRELLNYSVSFKESQNQLEDSSLGVPVSDFSIDDLFADTSVRDTVSETSGLSLTDVESYFESETTEAVDFSEVVTWSFILIKGRDGQTDRLKTLLFDKILPGNDVKCLSWVTAAGLSAQAPFAMQLAFNFGMIFIIIGSILVVTNALVITVFERTAEIGTMRAIGARKSYIRYLFIWETFILIMSGTVLGIVLGACVCAGLQKNGIHLDNQLLVTLFGGASLRPVVSAKIMAIQCSGSLAVGFLAWIFPVHVAVNIPPAQIIGKS